MILHRIYVENWRKLRAPVELAPLSESVNIIHGPNEAGKSTIMDAICRGFFDRHNTGGEAMKSRRPWGSTLGPTVEMEFGQDGQRYRLKKRFLDDTMAELSVRRDGAWEKLSQGGSADERIVELAFGDQAGRGLSKPEHWGLGQVLWAQQGSAAQIEVGDSQQGRLREALKVTLDSTQGETIEQAVAERYNQSYTPGGKWRSGQKNKAEVLELQEQLEEAREQKLELERQRNDLDELAHKLSAREDEYEQIEEELDQTERERAARRKELDALQARQREYEKLQADARETTSRWERLNEHSNRIAEAEKKRDEAAAEVSRKTQRHDRSREALQQIRSDHDTRKAACDALSDEVQRAGKALKSAERLVRWLEIGAQLDDLKRRLAQADKQRERLQEARRELDELIAPDTKALKALRTLHRDIENKQAEVNAASLTVRLEPECELTISIEADGESRPAHPIDQPERFQALSTMGLHIEGVGRLRIRAGQSDAATLADELARLKGKWAQKSSPFGHTELDKLEELSARRQQMENRVKQMRDQADEADDPDALNDRIQKLQAERATLLAEDESLKAETCDLPEARDRKRSAQREADETHARHQEALRLLETLSDGLEKARKDEVDAKSALDSATNMLQFLRDEAKKLSEEDGLDAATRRTQLIEARQAMDAARQRLEATEPPPVADLADDVAKLETQVGALQEDRYRLGREIATLSRDVERAGGQGLYSRYVEATERWETLDRRYARARLDAEAIALLNDTLQKHKRDVFESVLEPIRSIVVSSMQDLMGPGYDRVSFDERLRPTAVRPTAREVEAGIDDLSFGTREQLMLLVRLALARLLGREGQRQCVILDDPLVNTDRPRQRAALRVLEKAATETQILIFTCHPTAYQGLSDASAFDMRELTKDTE